MPHPEPGPRLEKGSTEFPRGWVLDMAVPTFDRQYIFTLSFFGASHSRSQGQMFFLLGSVGQKGSPMAAQVRERRLPCKQKC